MPRGERPLDPGDGLVVGFARDLRLLREKAGAPTYRDLGVRAHYSAAALSEAAGGRRLPSLSVTIAYVAACGGDTTEWEARWRTIAAELAEPAPDDDGEAPYVGLAAFQREDADRFFGRDELVADLLRRLRERRFLGILGASGSGKSSLLRAGLVAQLGTEPIVVFTPGQHPIEECAIHLAGFLDESPAVLRDEFSADPRNLHLRIRQAVVGRQTSDVLLVVDQFEELFTLCHDGRERAAFIDALVTATTDPAGRTRVVLGIRADFLGHCGDHPPLATALRDAQVLVSAMTTDELRLAITKPAEQAGYRVENALVTRLVADAARQPGMLPLISHALLRTWLRRHGKVMTVAGYDTVGGIEHALARSADETYQALDPDQQHAAKQIFLRLTALGEGTEDTKRRATRAELAATDTVLDTLARARLITLDHDSVDIAHEALIRHWPRLRDWLTDDREGHRLRHQLTDAALEWERHDRDEGLLYRGTRLARWQDRPVDDLTDAENAFLTTSRRAMAREHRQRRRRVRWTIGGLGVATVMVTVLAVVAFGMATRANDERALAVSRQLVTEARAQLQLDPELALLLAREAYKAMPNNETEAVLRQAVADSHLRFTLPETQNPISGVAVSMDRKLVAASGFDGAIRVWEWDAERRTWATRRRIEDRVAAGVMNRPLGEPVFSPDNRHLAAVNIDGVMLVWDLAGRGEPVRLGAPQLDPFRSGRSRTLAFSSDGRSLASGGTDGVIEIWHLDRPDQPDQPDLLPGHDGTVTSVDFSPDGRRLASSGVDGTVRIWTPGERGDPIVLRGHDGQVTDVAFSPDGHRVATTGVDNTVRVWDASGVADPIVLGSHENTGAAVAFSRDGRLIASTGTDNTVLIWDADHRAAPTVLRGHHGAVLDVAFGADSKSVVSGSQDGTVKIWDVDPVEDVTVFRGHEGEVRSIASTTDGRRIASGGADGTVRIWDLTDRRVTPQVLRGHQHPVIRVTFGRGGRFLVTLDERGTVLVWDMLDLTEPPLTLSSKDDVAFSPDGKRLALLSFGSLSIWDGTDDHLIEELTVLPIASQGFSAPLKVAWSPDGHHIAASSKEDVVHLWDLRDHLAPGRVLPGRPGLSQTLTFNQDGTLLASGGVEGAVTLWNVSPNPTQPVVLHGHQGEVWDATFSGRHLITSGSDGTVRIWNTDGESLVLGFRSPAFAVEPVADGDYLTAHADGTIRIWRCPACGPVSDVLATAERRVTRELTPQERQTYLPTE